MGREDYPTNQEKKELRLWKMKQGDQPLSKFCERWANLYGQLEDWQLKDKAQYVDWFFRGLNPSIQKRLDFQRGEPELEQFKDYTQLMKVAVEIDKYLDEKFCYFCHKPGHVRRECDYRLKNRYLNKLNDLHLEFVRDVKKLVRENSQSMRVDKNRIETLVSGLKYEKNVASREHREAKQEASTETFHQLAEVVRKFPTNKYLNQLRCLDARLVRRLVDLTEENSDERSVHKSVICDVIDVWKEERRDANEEHVKEKRACKIELDKKNVLCFFGLEILSDDSGNKNSSSSSSSSY